MNNNAPGRTNEDQLEKVLIGLVLGSILLAQLLFKNDETYAKILFAVHAVAFIGLIAFYIKTSPINYWSIFVGGLVFYALSKFYIIDHSFNGVLYVCEAVVLTLGGALLLFQSVKKSIEFKAFESLGFLLGLFLAVLPWLAIFLGKAFDGFPLLYNFGIAFIICTILYNDNLWDQYLKTQQKFIMLNLLMALTNIIVIASKQF